MAHLFHSRKKGFILLEALVFITLMMILGASMLATAYNDRQRSREYVLNNEAQSLAANALYLLVDSESQRIAQSGQTEYLGKTDRLETTLSVTPQTAEGESSYTLTGDVIITIAQPESNSSLYELTATAWVTGNTETESVSMTVQLISGDLTPPTLYGAGLSGWLKASRPQESGGTGDAGAFQLTLGTGTDLYLHPQDILSGQSNSSLTLLDSQLGGNVALDGPQVHLVGSSVTGMLVTNQSLTLESSIFNSTDGQGKSTRLTGIYMASSSNASSPNLLTMYPGNYIKNGSVYADSFLDYGGNTVAGGSVMVRSMAGQNDDDAKQKVPVVYGADGIPVYIANNPALQRAGNSNFSITGIGSLADRSSNLYQFQPKLAAQAQDLGSTTQLAPPTTDNANIYKVTQDSVATLSNSQPSPENKVGNIIYMEQGSTLNLHGSGPYYLYVYGSGQNCTVTVPSGATIYGCLQNVTVHIQNTEGQIPSLTLNYVPPVAVQGDESTLLAPSSQGHDYPYLQVISISRTNSHSE